MQGEHWGLEEKKHTGDSKELEKDRDVAKISDKGVARCDGWEVKSHLEEFPSKPKPSQKGSDARCETWSASGSRFVVQPYTRQESSGDRSLDPLAEALDLEIVPGSSRGPKDTASKPRKKRRPQSLNVEGSAKLIYRNGDTDSSTEGEENQGSDLDNTFEQSWLTTENQSESLPRVYAQEEERLDQAKKRGKQENPSIGGLSEQRVSPPRLTDTDPGYPGPANGPERPTPPSVGLRGEIVKKIQGKGLIDDKELAEVKLRQIRTHEKRVSGSGGEEAEGQAGRTSFQRLSGSSGSFTREITRIVPLKPERSKSVTCKDIAGPEESSLRPFRKEYRWSVGSSVEGPSDLHWTEDPHPDSEASQSGRGFAEGQSSASRIATLPKTVPPAPPVKTQKARESGLILRNSRSAGRDSSADAAKKRHSVTLPSSSLASAIPIIGMLKSIA